MHDVFPYSLTKIDACPPAKWIFQDSDLFDSTSSMEADINLTSNLISHRSWNRCAAATRKRFQLDEQEPPIHNYCKCIFDRTLSDNIASWGTAWKATGKLRLLLAIPPAEARQSWSRQKFLHPSGFHVLHEPTPARGVRGEHWKPWFIVPSTRNNRIELTLPAVWAQTQILISED